MKKKEKKKDVQAQINFQADLGRETVMGGYVARMQMPSSCICCLSVTVCPLHVCLRVNGVFCIYFSVCLSGHTYNPFYQFFQGSVNHNYIHLAVFVKAHI